GAQAADVEARGVGRQARDEDAVPGRAVPAAGIARRHARTVDAGGGERGGRLLMFRAAVIALLAVGCSNKANLQKAEEEGLLLRMDLAHVMIHHGTYDAAMPLLQRLIAEAPKNVRPRILYATVLRQRGLYGQAVAQYREAIKLAPKDPAAYAGL